MLTSVERLLACWLLAAALAAGIFIPGLSETLAPYAFPALFCMIILSLVPMARLDAEEIFSLDKNIWQIVLWQLFALPGIILAGAYLARLHDSIITLIVVTACAGSLFASPAFADLLKLNKRKALQCMILSTFMMPISYFFFLTAILHSSVELNFKDFAHRCSTFLIMPTGLFCIYTGIARDLPERLVKGLENASRRLVIFALMVFGIGILGPARDLLWADFGRFMLHMVIVTSLGAGMAYLTAVVMFRQGITDALTASIVSGFRNVGLGFALLADASTPETAAYVGISQIPIFLAPLVVHYLVRGSREAEAGHLSHAVPHPA
jgi:BASS family bile acid:Na+ symporter